MFHTCLLKFIYSVFIIQCSLYEMFTEFIFVPPCFVSQVEVVLPVLTFIKIIANWCDVYFRNKLRNPPK